MLNLSSCMSDARIQYEDLLNMATMYDVCKEAGVSTATVSRVINNSPNVSKRSRKSVLRAMDKLGFRPNQAARSLAGKRTDTIGVVLPEIDNGFYAQVLRGLNEAARQNHKHLLTAFYDNADELKDILRSLAQPGRVDAVVVLNSSLTPPQLEQIVSDHVPMVLIGPRNEGSELFDVVGIDNVAGAYAATSYLLSTKPGKLLLITGPKHFQDSCQRLDGAMQAVADVGFHNVEQIHGFFTFQSGKDAMSDYLKCSAIIPDAIFAFNDMMALGAIEAMSSAGIQQGQVEIIGFDGSELAHFANLKSVRVPMRDLGFEAGTLAIRRMSDQCASSTTTIRLAATLEL